MNKLKELPTLSEIRKEKSRRNKERSEESLIGFIKKAWPVAEPATEFINGWHIDAICEHLEAVNNGEIRKLLINMPPRHMKSLAIAVFWPCWTWIHNPSIQWLYSSYAGNLSIRDNVKSRRLIQSQWYQNFWGEKFDIIDDQNTKIKFENSENGYRMATSVDGQTTGEGGDIIVVDDPHHAKEVRSKTKREAVLTWWDEVMSTRLNDPKKSSRVIVMQRLHEKDLSGHVLEKGGYEHLCLPAEYEPKRKCSTSIGYSDPREESQELLWPERFGREEIENLKVDLGSYAAAGQLQQQPSPQEGGLFSKEDFEIIESSPIATEITVRYWDMAATEETPGTDPDWSSGLKFSLKNGIYYVEHLEHFRASPNQTEQKIIHTSELDGSEVIIGIEQEPGSSGKMVINYFKKKLYNRIVYGNKVTGSKVDRAFPLSVKAEAGLIKLVRAGWNSPFLDELDVFPYGEHDDIVDSLSGAYEIITVIEEIMEGLPDEQDNFDVGGRVQISSY